MNNHFKFILVIMVLLATSYAALAAEIDLLGLTLDVKESGIDLDNVNITVEIYDAATGRKEIKKYILTEFKNE